MWRSHFFYKEFSAGGGDDSVLGESRKIQNIGMRKYISGTVFARHRNSARVRQPLNLPLHINLRHFAHSDREAFHLGKLQLAQRIGNMEMADFHAVGRFFPDEGAALDVLEKKIRSSVCCGQICADDSAGFRAAAGRVEFGIQQNAGRNLRNRGGEIRLGGFKVEQKLIMLRTDPHDIV